MNTKAHLDSLQKKHQKLDLEIRQQETSHVADEVQLHALKRQKLKIKDEIIKFSHQPGSNQPTIRF